MGLDCDINFYKFANIQSLRAPTSHKATKDSLGVTLSFLKNSGFSDIS